jgi:hypothetical protein
MGGEWLPEDGCTGERGHALKLVARPPLRSAKRSQGGLLPPLPDSWPLSTCSLLALANIALWFVEDHLPAFFRLSVHGGASSAYRNLGLTLLAFRLQGDSAYRGRSMTSVHQLKL